MQGRLFPLLIERMDPANFGTAVCNWTGIGEDGLCYALKRVSDGPLIPAAEWICSCISHACGIPIPHFDICRTHEGEHLFGSRWEAGLYNPVDAARLFASGKLAINEPASRVTAIHVLDLFLDNPDRHLKNYLYRAPTGPAPAALLAFDFSHAFCAIGWPPAHAIPRPGSHTQTVGSHLLKLFGFDAHTASSIIDRLESMGTREIEAIIEPLPPALLDAPLRETIKDWWADNRIQRLSRIRDYLNHAYAT